MTSARQVAVVVTKPSGKRVVFSLHDNEREAESTAQRLRGFGLDVATELTRAGVLAPGMNLPGTAAAK